MTSWFPSFNWGYLTYWLSIFSRFWYLVAETILYEKLPFIFHFDDVVIVEFSIKGDNS